MKIAIKKVMLISALIIGGLSGIITARGGFHGGGGHGGGHHGGGYHHGGGHYGGYYGHRGSIVGPLVGGAILGGAIASKNNYPEEPTAPIEDYDEEMEDVVVV